LILIEKNFLLSQQWFMSVEITFFKVLRLVILYTWIPLKSISDLIVLSNLVDGFYGCNLPLYGPQILTNMKLKTFLKWQK